MQSASRYKTVNQRVVVSSRCNIEDTNFARISSSDHGGSIFVSGAFLCKVIRCSFKTITTTGYGACIGSDSASCLLSFNTHEDCAVTTWVANHGGHAYYFYKGSCDISQVSANRCCGTQSIGENTININNADSKIRCLNITNSHAHEGGSPISLEANRNKVPYRFMNIAFCTGHNAIESLPYDLGHTVELSTFVRNTALNVLLHTTSSYPFSFNRCFFSGNTLKTVNQGVVLTNCFGDLALSGVVGLSTNILPVCQTVPMTPKQEHFCLACTVMWPILLWN